MHLEGELYDYPSWVWVALCAKHEAQWISSNSRKKGRAPRG